MGKNNFYLNKEPKKWQRCGVVLKRGDIGEYDSSVTGDPCIVWDKYNNCYS